MISFISSFLDTFLVLCMYVFQGETLKEIVEIYNLEKSQVKVAMTKDSKCSREHHGLMCQNTVAKHSAMTMAFLSV